MINIKQTFSIIGEKMSIKIKGTTFGDSAKGAIFAGNTELDIEDSHFGNTQGHHIVAINTSKRDAFKFNGCGLSVDTPDAELLSVAQELFEKKIDTNNEQEVNAIFEEKSFDKWVAVGANVCTIAGFILSLAVLK